MNARSSGSRYTFGASPYANAIPLSRFIRKVCPSARVVGGDPSSLARRVLEGAVDLGLVPVADLLAHPQLKMVDGLGVCARQRVLSVLIKLNRPAEHVRTVWLDRASHTSNGLAGILLQRRFRVAPRMTYPQEGQTADAEVVIGDRALCSKPAPCGDLDMAEHWHQMTGLPFVFAVWAYRQDHRDPQGLAEVAHAAKQEGMAAIGELIESEARRLGIGLERSREYFQTAIHYDVGQEELQAIRLFRMLLDPSYLSALAKESSAARTGGGAAQ